MWGERDAEWMSLFTCLVLAEEEGGTTTFWGKGPVGPDVSAAQIIGYWRISGGS